MSHALYTPRLSLSPRKMRPEDAKEMYLQSCDRFQSSKRAGPGSALNFWEAYVAKTNAQQAMMLSEHQAVVARRPSPRLSPRGGLSPRANLQGARLPPLSAAAALMEQTKGGGSPRQMSEEAQKEYFAIAEAALRKRFTDMQQAFKYIDVNNTGTIDRLELEKALHLWGVIGDEGPDGAVEAVIKACDLNGDGIIEYDEFVQAMANDKYIDALSSGKTAKVKLPTDPLQAVMTKLKPGVSPEELQRAHRILKDKLSTKYGTVGRAFRTWDEDHNGFINMTEFKAGLLDLNLDGIRQPVIESLLDIADTDDDTTDVYHTKMEHDIQFREFARVFTADDIMQEVASYNATKRASAPAPAPEEAEPPSIGQADAFHDKAGYIVAGATRPEAASPRAQSPRAQAAAAKVTNLGFDETAAASRAPPKRKGKVPYRSSDIKTSGAELRNRKKPVASKIEAFLASVPGAEEIKQVRQVQAQKKLPYSVSADELRFVQRLLKGKITDRYSRMDRAFKNIDHARRNKLTREVMRQACAEMNLPVGSIIREEVFDTLFDWMDIDDSGEVDFAEFSKVLSADDIMTMAPVIKF